MSLKKKRKEKKQRVCEVGQQIKVLAVKFDPRELHGRMGELTPVSCLLTLCCTVQRLIYNIILGMPL